MKWNLFTAIFLLLASPSPLLAGSLTASELPAAGFPHRGVARHEQAIEAARFALAPHESDALIFPGSAPWIELPSMDRQLGVAGPPLRYHRIGLFAPAARIFALVDGAASQLSPGMRQFYLATDRSTGVGLAVDPLSGAVSGFATRGRSRMEINGNLVGAIELGEVSDAPDNECGTETAQQPIDAELPGAIGPYASVSAAEPGSALTYQAVVAVDTDSEWLNFFGDDTDEAMTWITDAFLAMNVFFERDVETRMLIGDVMLRVGSDPYSEPGDRFAQLNEFGAYWKDNMGGVERQFAAMFSGRSISAGGFSGIAWINQYCAYGRNWSGNTSGSYSFNAIGSARTPGNTALYIGHELGHNMGSRHTHCYNPPVDHCYNNESGCFDGDPVCPASGRGTIMSYCHVGGSNGAGCGTSNSEFHPTVQGLLEGRLADELAAGCILPYSDYTPSPEFVATPAAGETLDFGEHRVGSTAPGLSVRVENAGDADLEIACGLSGSDSASFDIDFCGSLLAPGSTTDVTVSCTPGVSGALGAELVLATNDEDEPAPSWLLQCRGAEPEPPDPDVIFDSDFESLPD
jgi:hypothetical protein